MHYKNGQEAKAGDLVYKPNNPTFADQEMIGVLVSATAGSTTCNGQVQSLASRYKSDAGPGPWMPASGVWCATVGDLYPLDPAPLLSPPEPSPAQSLNALDHLS